MTVDLDPVRRIVAQDHGLASIAVVRADGTPHTSLVNAGVLDHPRTAEPVVGYVTYGKVKLRNLRERPAHVDPLAGGVAVGGRRRAEQS